MADQTDARYPGEHARPGSPPGWYADPVRESSLRRWNGEHWTADVEQSTTVVEVQPSVAVLEVEPSAQRRPLNWPAFVVALMAAWYWAWWFMGFRPLLPSLGEFTVWVIGPLALVPLGMLGSRRKYSPASRIVAVASVLIGGVSLGYEIRWFLSTISG